MGIKLASLCESYRMNFSSKARKVKGSVFLTESKKFGISEWESEELFLEIW